MHQCNYLVLEPGYYKDGEFGIRLENIVYVKKVDTKVSCIGVLATCLFQQ